MSSSELISSCSIIHSVAYIPMSVLKLDYICITSDSTIKENVKNMMTYQMPEVEKDFGEQHHRHMILYHTSQTNIGRKSTY